MFSVRIQIERWRWNRQYGVWVSNMGNFRNRKKQPISLKISQKDYMMVPISDSYKPAHRLVMLTWCPIPNSEKYTVDHKNHNKRENNYKNLEWVTEEENQKRAREDLIVMEQDRLENRLRSLQENQNKDFEICYGKSKFSTFEQAAKFIMKKQGMNNNNNESKIRNIKRQIWNSIMQKNPYCKKCWIINMK